jgi:hypothetical protein
MNSVALPLFLLMCGSTFSVAQTNSHSNPAKVLQRYSLLTLIKYCDRVERFANTQPPRIFARKPAVFGRSLEWAEFFSIDEWRQAGKPQPLALVWYKEDGVARVAITPPNTRADGNSYTDYCYRPDGSLARLRSVPETQADCDQSSLRCSYTFRVERLYPPGLGDQGPSSVTQQPISLDRYSVDRRPLKSEKTSFVFAPMEWPEYLNVSDLPFNQLLYASSQ